MKYALRITPAKKYRNDPKFIYGTLHTLCKKIDKASRSRAGLYFHVLYRPKNDYHSETLFFIHKPAL